MNESLQTFVSPVALLIAAAIFVILLTVILITLRRAGVFPGGVNVTLAICASLLAVVGIMRTFGHAEEITRTSRSGWLDVILLPYTAMGIAMLLVLLVLLLRKVVSGREKALRRPKRQIRSESHERAGSETEHKESSEMSQLAKK